MTSHLIQIPCSFLSIKLQNIMICSLVTLMINQAPNELIDLEQDREMTDNLDKDFKKVKAAAFTSLGQEAALLGGNPDTQEQITAMGIDPGLVTNLHT